MALGQPALKPSGHDAVDAGKVLVSPHVENATSVRDCSDNARLTHAEFDKQPTARGEYAPRFLQDSSIGAQSVNSAVQRKPRIEIADLARQPRKVGRGNVGRVRDNQVKSPFEATRPVANSNLGPKRQAARLKIAPRDVCCIA